MAAHPTTPAPPPAGGWPGGDGAGIGPHRPAVEPRAPEVDAADFFAVDMRVGTVVAAEVLAEARVPAYRMRVDLGELGVVRSSARLTDHYRPEDLVGTQVVVVANLPPRQVGPVRSEVLVLGVYEQGSARVVLLRPDHPCRNGDRVG